MTNYLFQKGDRVQTIDYGPAIVTHRFPPIFDHIKPTYWVTLETAHPFPRDKMSYGEDELKKLP